LKKRRPRNERNLKEIEAMDETEIDLKKEKRN
jgi:hypothetical protein